MESKSLISIEYFEEANNFRLVNLGSTEVPVLKNGKVLRQKITTGMVLTDLIETLKLSEFCREHNKIYIEENVIFIEVSDDATTSKNNCNESYELKFSYDNDNKEYGVICFPKNVVAKVSRNGVVTEFKEEHCSGYEFDNFRDFIDTIKVNKLFERYKDIKIHEASLLLSI